MSSSALLYRDVKASHYTHHWWKHARQISSKCQNSSVSQAKSFVIILTWIHHWASRSFNNTIIQLRSDKAKGVDGYPQVLFYTFWYVPLLIAAMRKKKKSHTVSEHFSRNKHFLKAHRRIQKVNPLLFASKQAMQCLELTTAAHHHSPNLIKCRSVAFLDIANTAVSEK